MPHIVFEYSVDHTDAQAIKQLMDNCFDVCREFECINPKAIKLRAIPVELAYYGNGSESFIHARAHLLDGRTTERKAAISKAILDCTMMSLPHVETFSVEIVEMDKETYQKNA